VGGLGHRVQAVRDALAHEFTRAGGAGALVIVLLVGAALAFGGVHLPSRLVLSGLALAGVAVVGRARARHGQRLILGWVGLGLLVALAWTFFQWVPLPRALVAALAPASAAARAAAAQALDVSPPSWMPMTLDGPATATAWVSLAGALAVFVLGSTLAREGRARAVLAAVELAALATLAVGVVQVLVGTDRIYGVYRPTLPPHGLGFLTSFVNPNHAGALMLLGALAAFGMWSGRREGPRGTLHLGILSTLVVGILATGSRANLLLVLAALGTLGVVSWLQAEPDSAARGQLGRVLLGVLGLSAAGAFLVWGLRPPQAQAAGQGLLDWSEAAQRWHVGAGVVAAHPWSGVGLGAFPREASRFMESWDGGFVDFAHNLGLRLAAAWGIPVALLVGLLVGGGWLGRLLAVRRKPELLAAGVAVAAVALQNTVDFSLALPGVGYAAVALLGALAGYPAAKLARRGAGGRGRPSWLAWLGRGRAVSLSSWGVVVLVAGLVLTGRHATMHGARAWGAAARQALDEGKPGRVDLALMLGEHPADFYLFTLGAEVALRRGGEAARDVARRLSARAVELAPTERDALWERARVELEAGDAGAALPFAVRAARSGKAGPWVIAGKVLGYAQVPGLLDGFVRAEARLAGMVARRLTGRGRWAEAFRVYDRALGVFPDAVALRRAYVAALARRPGTDGRLARLATEALGRGGAAQAAGEGQDLSAARRWLEVGYLAQGYVSQRAGRFEEAWHLFDEAWRQGGERSLAPLVAKADMLAQVGDLDRLAVALEELRKLGPEDDDVQAHLHRLASRLAEGRGDLREAVRELQRALVYAQRDGALRQRLATLYDRLGEPQAAQRARGEL